MQLSQIRQALEKEDSTPVVIFNFWFIGLALFFFLWKYFPFLADENAPEVPDDELGKYLFVTFLLTVLFIWSLLVLKRAIQKDIRRSKEKMDERELLHNYQVAKTGYVVAVIGICAITIFGPIQIDAYGGALSGIELFFLLGIMLFMRLRKRIILEQQN